MEYGGVLYIEPRTMSAAVRQTRRPDAESVACWWETVHRTFAVGRKNDGDGRGGGFALPPAFPLGLVRALAKLKTQEKRMGCAYSPEIFARAVATPLPE